MSQARPQAQAQARQHPPISQGRNARTGIGPEVLDLFTAIYDNFQTRAAIQRRIEVFKDDIMRTQGTRDIRESVILHQRGDTRMDFEYHVDVYRNNIARLEDKLENTTREYEALKERAARNDSIKGQHWCRLYDKAHEYFNTCLAVGFDAEWSLREFQCQDLREIMDIYHWIGHTEARIQRADAKWKAIRHDQYRAKRESANHPPRRPLDLSRRLEEVLREDIDAELAEAEAEWEHQQDLLQLRRDFYARDQDLFCRNVLRHLLARANRLEVEELQLAEASGRSNGNVTRAPPDGAIQPGNATRRDGSSSRSPVNQAEVVDRREHTNHTDEDLQERYLDTQNRLGELQHARDEMHRKIRADEVEHLITFTDSTREKYEALHANEFSSKDEQIEQVEQELVAIGARIVAAGQQIPRSPAEESLRNVRGGGIRKTHRSSNGSSPRSPPRQTRASRARNSSMNRWRMQNIEAAREIVSPSSGKSVGGLEDLRSRSRTVTPRRDQEWEEYIQEKGEEYRKMQDDLRKRRN